MKYCEFCERDVRPAKDFSWVGFIFGLGIFYLVWYAWKAPHCPICHAKMGRIKKD